MSSSPLASSQLMANSQRAEPEASPVARRGIAIGILPPPVMVLLSILSIQLGAAIAKIMLGTHTASTIVLMRAGFAAMVLWLVAPLRLRQYSKQQWFYAAMLGVVIAALNVAFYQSVSRIPLGITMTIQFLGPLAVAVAASRRMKDIIWPILALGGVLLLAPTGNLRSLSLTGMAFAVAAAILWAGYVILTKKTTAMFSSTTGLTLAMTVGTVAILPFGVLNAGKSLFDFSLLASGLLVSVLSTMIPFSLEFLALKRMSSRTFGILVSLDPSVAALIGLLMLHEHLALRAWAALTLVSVATLGVMYQDGKSQGTGKLEFINNL